MLDVTEVPESADLTFLQVDIHVPDHLKDKFSEMTPVFKNTVVTRNDIGQYMEDYLTENNVDFPDTRYLIGSMFGTKILLITPLAQWYMEQGLVITKVYQLIQFKPEKCFEKFADMVTNDRRAGRVCSTLKTHSHLSYDHSQLVKHV